MTRRLGEVNTNVLDVDAARRRIVEDASGWAPNPRRSVRLNFINA
jgi:hypothetical protein